MLSKDIKKLSLFLMAAFVLQIMPTHIFAAEPTEEAILMQELTSAEKSELFEEPDRGVEVEIGVKMTAKSASVKAKENFYGIEINSEPDPWFDDPDTKTFYTVEEYQAATLEERELKINDPNWIDDEDFYGKWNSEKGEWEIPGEINYDYTSDDWDCTPLKEAGEAVKEGDYETAKLKLIVYYQNKARYRGYTYNTNYKFSSKQKFGADLLARNIHAAGNSSNFGVDYLVNIKNANEAPVPADEKVTVDITDKFSRGDGRFMLALYSLNKDGSRIRIRSREQTEYAPVIRVTINGVVRILPCTGDTYCCPLSNIPKGTEDKILVESSVSSIAEEYYFDKNTKEGFIRFDTSAVNEGERVSNATLEFYAVNETNEGVGELLLACDDRRANMDEETEYYGMPGRSGGVVNYSGDSYPVYIAKDGKWPAWFKLSPIVGGSYTFSGYVGVMAEAGTACPEFYQGVYLRYMMAYAHQQPNLIKYIPGGSIITYAIAMRERGFFSDFMNKAVFYPVLTTDIFSGLLKNAFILESYYSTYGMASANNTTVQDEATFLTYICALPEFRRTDEFLDNFNQDMTVMLDNLHDSDYSYNEASIGYTEVGLNAIRDLNVIPENWKLEEDILSEENMGTLEKMAVYLADMLAPGFQTPVIGDDNCGVVGVKFSQYLGERLNNQRLLYTGSQGEGGQKPDYTSVIYDAANRAAMRTGWGDNDLYMYTDADAGYYNHGHPDDLNIVAFAYGEALIADSARNGYEFGPPRSFSESTKAHNLVVINDMNQKMNAKRDSETGEVTEVIGQRGTLHNWETNGSYDFLKMSTPNNPEFDYTRSILFIKPGFWIVSDYIKPEQTGQVNNYSQYWHIRPEGQVSLDEKTGIMRNQMPKASIVVAPADPEKYTEFSIISDGYCEYTYPVPYVKMEQETAGNVSFDTVLYPTPAGNNLTVETEPIELQKIYPTDASAFNMTVSETGKKTFDGIYYIVHEKNRIAERKVGDYTYNGEMFYLQKETGNLQRLVLADGTGSYDKNEHKTQVGERPAGDLTLEDKNGDVIFKALDAVPQLGIEVSNGVMKLMSSVDIDLTKLTIKRDTKIKSVLYNGQTVDFNDANGYIYFGNEPILVGEEDPDDNSGSSSSVQNPGHGGGGSGIGGGSSTGVNTGGNSSGTPGGNPGGNSGTKPSDPKEELKQELAGRWSENEIGALIDQEVVQGGEDGLHLTDKVTRAEFIALLARGLDIPKASYRGEFGDVTASDWYADAIQAAADAGLVNGDDGMMRPNDPITREEMAKIAVAAYEREKADGYAEHEARFTDAEQISDWAKAYADQASRLELIRGFEDGSFRPKENSLREQAMVVVYRVMQKLA